MNRGIIPISKDYELEYRYYEKDTSYKYFNRKFEIYLIGKKTLKKTYILHMDNCDTNPSRWSPHIHKASNVSKKLYFGVTTLNWNDIKDNFINCVAAEIGPENEKFVRKAVAKLSSPKI